MSIYHDTASAAHQHVDFASVEIGRGAYYRGDCLEIMQSLIDQGFEGSIDSVVTDPPYHLTSTVKRFGKPGSAPAQHGKDGLFARASKGFMAQTWDGGYIAFQSKTWELAYRLLKPGGHLLAFGGSRTYHRLAVAVEDAGFEIRDQVMWLYGSGFPKSVNVSKAIDSKLGAVREKVRIPASEVGNLKARQDSRPWIEAAIERGYHELDGDKPATPEAAAWDGWGSALKPAHEPLVLARKPLSGTVAENVLEHGTGAINIDDCRIPGRERTDYGLQSSLKSKGSVYGQPSSDGADFDASKGRWPANVIHDGSDEVEAAFAAYGTKSSGKPSGVRKADHHFETSEAGTPITGFGDSGSASRFFYSAKANKGERADSSHPTVKPLALMRYLTRLVTPPGGVVFDPFAGSGTTLEAAILEGFCGLGVEMTPDYWRDIEARLRRCQPDLAA